MSRGNFVFMRAYAKINLTLEVLQRLPDGYHEIASVMQQVELHDDIFIQRRSDQEIIVKCNTPGIPLDHQNLAWRAVEVIREQLNIKLGVDIQITKRIPVAGGLAGGSSDAAATLKGLNKLYKLSLTQEDILRLAEKLGMDVPFCVLGGTALVRGKGQIVSPLPPIPKHSIVIANPGLGISTREAYQSLDQILDWTQQRSHSTPFMVSALQNGRANEINGYFHNDFEEIISQNMPIFSYIKDVMLINGAQIAQLSGSGSSVFCIADSPKQALTIARALQLVVPNIFISHTVS